MTREEARERAMALFSEGYNCAQAVVGTFAQSLGFDFETGMLLYVFVNPLAVILPSTSYILWKKLSTV